MFECPVRPSLKTAVTSPSPVADDQTSEKTRYRLLGSKPAIGLINGAMAWVGPKLLPASLEAAISISLPELFAFGPERKETYTLPSGPIVARASWSNLWAPSLTRIGPVQVSPSLSE